MTQRHIIDLSLAVDTRLPNAQVDPYKSIDVEGWNATMLRLYSHCGTHMDAPFHFLPDGETMESLNLQAYCGAARVVDLSPVEPAELLTVERFEAALDSAIEPSERLLLRSDWSTCYPSQEYRDRLPRISLELAEWLVEKQVRLVGVEPPSVADVNNSEELTAVHQTLFRGGVVIVESLCQLDKIESDRCEFIALPLRIVGGDGCPVRAIAIVREEEPSPAETFGFARE